MSRHASKILKANADRPACPSPRQRCEEHEHAALLLQWSRSPSFKTQNEQICSICFLISAEQDGARQSRLSFNKADHLKVMRLLGKWKFRSKTRNICRVMSRYVRWKIRCRIVTNFPRNPRDPWDPSMNAASKSSRAKINEISPWKGICRSTSRHHVTTSPRRANVSNACPQKLLLRNTSEDKVRIQGA